MASERAKELEQKLENIEYDMERVGGWQQNHNDAIVQMGQYFDYLGNDPLRQASEAEGVTDQRYEASRSTSGMWAERESQQWESYRQGTASFVDVQQVHTQYVNSMETTVEAARAHERSMRQHAAVQEEYVEVVRNNILAEEARQREMAQQNRLAEHVRRHQPAGNSRDPGGSSSSRRHDPSTRGHGAKKKKHGRR
ncbi:hypothetical protein HTV45_17420 [Streptomyces sp. CHD11]|uniref:hypothetical protein n=1 Tax=Streptomyces sp. CHD11 TaxID=2741325 RepID=UPI001BFC267C|nr:hypothetical protein [Streptomyces sp. CHD11]MBT3152632.1 hypothetical protein [Streptomyces sp. CHD11]